jgi:polar amino acid transport system substrate-binding protein
MRTYRCFVFSFVVAGLLSLTACVSTWETPSPSSAQATWSVAPEVQQALAPTGVLRVGVYLGSPTSWVRDAKTGQSHGLALDLGYALGQQLGVPVQVVEYPRVAEVIAGLKKAEVDMTFTNATSARAKEVDFTPALIQLELGLLVPANSRIQSFADVDRAGVRLGVSQGSSSQGVLGARLKQAAVVPVASLNMVQQMLQRGELDAFATNKGILFELAEKLPGAQVLKDHWGLESLAIAIPKGREAGMPYLRDFAQTLKRQGHVQRMADLAGLRGLAESQSQLKD